ncbi:MAG: TolC family protein [Flavobacteriales bacterium]|jgi:outer membrane protein|nr:TolC family protein [Flavobacteriales bacterium]
MIKYGLSIILALSLVVGKSQGDSTGSVFSLSQALEYATENSNKAKRAAAQVEITVKKKKEVRAIGLPQINGEVKFQNFLDIPTTLVPANAFNPLAPEDEFAALQFGTDYSTSAGLTASQLLFDGSYLVGLKIADDYTGLYTQQEEKTLIEIKDDVTKAYYNALVAFETKDLLLETLKSMQKTLQDIIAMNEAGFIDELSVDQQKLQVSSLESKILSVDRQINMGLDFLKLNMGMEISDPITLTDNLSNIVAELNYEDLSNQNFSIEKSIDYRILQTSQNILKLSLQNEQFANLPSLSAYFSHTQNNMGNDIDFETWYPTTLWGINASIPIFGSGSRMYKSQIAKIEVERGEMQMTEVEQALKMASSSAKSELMNAYEQNLIAKKNVEISDRILSTTTTKFKEGVASSLELAQAQAQQIEIQQQYVQSLFQLLNAKTKLDKAHNNY